MENWGTCHPRRILHAPGGVRGHDGVYPGEPRTQAYGPQMSVLQTGPL